MVNKRLGWLVILLLVGSVMLSGCAERRVSIVSASEDEPSAGAQVQSPPVGGLAESTAAPANTTGTAEAAAPVQVTGAAGTPDPVNVPVITGENDPADPTAGAPVVTPSEAARVEEDWQNWPALPVVPAGLREIYQQGIAKGSNPHAFSILGDCQSQPDVFMGVFDSQPEEVKSLSPALQETVAYFAGSFDRYSPTVKDATTEGALLWAQWNDNKEKKCKPGETPLDCELRTHRPSLVFIHIGTHWEARNRQYLNTIIDKTIASGAVPILVTKADNREKDERVNKNLASLAVERGLPLWNFWASIQHLPDNGLKEGSDMYLNQEAVEIHRMGAIQALDAVWRALR